MWSLEIALAAPSVRDVEHLADIAGTLLDELDHIAGDVAPVVSGQFVLPQPILLVSVDVQTNEPANAVAEALRLIALASSRAAVSLGEVRTISLHLIDELQETLDPVSA